MDQFTLLYGQPLLPFYRATRAHIYIKPYYPNSDPPFLHQSEITRAIWLEHSDNIIANILEPRISDYRDAAELAILEETWSDNGYRGDPIPVRLCLSHLLHNADLASSATVGWDAYQAKLRSYQGYRPPKTTYTSIAASYYLTR